MIRSNLFSRGHPLKAEAGLSDALERHKQIVLKKIRAISHLDQMTDALVERLLKDFLVEPLAIHFGKMTRKHRNETFDLSLTSETFGIAPEGGDQRQVVRLTVPFTGEADLLKFCPNPCGFTFPQGEVHGHTIQFDVILWGTPEDGQRVKKDIRENLDLIADYAGKINQQVKAFNESLPAHVKSAFTAKLEELTKQHAVFDDLGIPEEPEPAEMPTHQAAPQPKKGKARAVQIIQNVETMLVQQLHQTNYNVGDVNNAIQSGE